MAEPIAVGNKQDITVVDAVKVVCDGPGFSRHPRVFLTMVDDAQGKPDHVVCPYCSHVFKFSGKAVSAAH